FMLQQVSIKVEEGFSCLKLKVGGLNFEKETDILQFIRRKYFRDTITIRLDANGAFKPDLAMFKLIECSQYDVHSIEQPLKAGSLMLPELCRQSPIPIALDEELIGVTTKEEKLRLLDRIRPQYIILKPTLHGGLSGCEEWIALATEQKIGWWMTSALESNIGLNAIAQFTSNYPVSLPQGLGTGAIYTDNVPAPLEVVKGTLRHNSQENWDLSQLN
ncbi:MAG: o-succinylbenzoate synthase, partial [Cyclobacteriaceae bacterium]|nr:o-succinylbenzoate synthase [Cyclobacteriaceae bacterium]